jgi:dipeptidyl aminopeptidase/acylaminoacyl peptidase
MSKAANSEVLIIPRRLLLRNPSAILPKLSPDGRLVAWFAPADGVMNVWAGPADTVADGAPLTRLPGRPPVWHDWSADGRFVLFLKDENGDENYSLFAVDARSSEVRHLTPLPKISARVILISPDLPDRILVGLNDRDPRWHDVWSVRPDTGDRELVHENTERFGWRLFDWQGRLRLGFRNEPEKGGNQSYRMESGRPEPWRLVSFDDAFGTSPLLFDRSGERLFALSSIGRDKAALVSVDMATEVETMLAEHPRADIGGVIWDQSTFIPAAAGAAYLRQEWIALDECAARTINTIRAAASDCDFYQVSASEDDRFWTIEFHGPTRPADYYLVDREAGALRHLFSARPDLAPYRLAGATPAVIKSRDGLDLVSYVTLPADEPSLRPRAPLPTVLVVHGGPWGRDVYGYDREKQWLANRGYAVLAVNYRASTGFGKAFVNAGDKEHAAKIHADLIDAVEWAIREGIADRDRVAIMGASYGGYAAFVGATFTPDVFACSLPIVGIADLVTLIDSVPPYWADILEHFYRRYGDPRTEEGRVLLRARSPLYRAEAVAKPMLIAHGANDVRCTLVQSDAIVAAMQRHGLPATYVVFPDEGHGFAKPENRLAYYALAEQFLARFLGGRAEPIGSEVAESSAEIRAGEADAQFPN